MKNRKLNRAKNEKNDEFYTQFRDVEYEIATYVEYDPDVFRGKTVLLPCDDPEWSNFTKYFAQNFMSLGLKKLISTSYAANSKKFDTGYQPTLFEENDPQYDKTRTRTNGKIFVLTKGKKGNKRVDIEDLKWSYLEGDGDYRSNEIMQLRDEADFIITNPPFSLFREFLAWILESKKKFSIIGNINAAGYKVVFPRLRDNEIWLGSNHKVNTGTMYFEVPASLADTEVPSEAKIGGG